MKLIRIILLSLGLSLVPTPAYADQQEEPCHGEDSCKGDCAETESGGYCSDDDLSPRFDDSPVRDSFNFGPVICLPMSTCNIDKEDQPQ